MTTSMDIKAADVQKLRQMTGAGLMDCKQALIDASGNIEKAAVILRERGIAKSAKRADRVAAEGLVAPWISDDGKSGILLELNCETDFVARNEEFAALAKDTLAAIKANPSWTDASQVPQESALAFSGKIGEKISLRRFARFQTTSGVVTSYIHPGAKLGVLVQIDSDKPATEDLKALSKEIALQIAGANPAYVSRTDVPAEILEREKDIAKKQMEGQKKPAEVLEKIAIGKLSQFFEQQCLLDQPYVKEPSGKTKVQALVDAAAKKDGSKLNVVKFVRFRVGAD